MKILVTGATGFVGRRLIHALDGEGHELHALTRNAGSFPKSLPAKAFSWDAMNAPPPADAVNEVEAVIHLAGENIAGKRWSPAQKALIEKSRTQTTENLLKGLAAPEAGGPHTVISASAVGYYGDRGNERLDEGSEPGRGFLPRTCLKWEASARDHVSETTRLVLMRIGIVLGDAGGALQKMLPVFRMGMGGPLGGGSQWMSWIHIDDLIGLFLHALHNKDYRGAVNGVAPSPVTNREFAKALGEVLHRPAFLPTPALALKLAMGEMAAIVLEGQRVIPTQALARGYDFRFSHVKEALRNIVQRD